MGGKSNQARVGNPGSKFIKEQMHRRGPKGQHGGQKAKGLTPKDRFPRSLETILILYRMVLICKKMPKLTQVIESH